MAKINDTTIFPVTDPAVGDLVIGTDISDTGNSADGETVNFSIGDIINLTPIGTELIEVITPTTVSEIDIALPSTSSFGSVTIELQNIGMTSSTGQVLQIQTSSDGGSTFASGAASYNANGTDTSAIEITNNTKNNDNKGTSGEIKIYGYDISTSWTVIRSNLSFEDGTISGDLDFKTVQAWRKNSEITTHIRLKFSAGSNFNSGQGRIIVRGHRRV